MVFCMHWPRDDFRQGLNPIVLTEKENKYLQEHRDAYGVHSELADLLFWLAVKNGGKNIVEIGVGHSTTPLILAAHRNGGTLFSTDIGTVHHISPDELKSELSSIWTFRPGVDSVEMGKRWNEERWNGERRGPIDFLFLDTSHTYQQTSSELEAWMPHMKIGGYFVMHDVSGSVGICTVFKAISDYMTKINDDVFEYHHYPYYLGVGILIKVK